MNDATLLLELAEALRTNNKSWIQEIIKELEGR
jgi:hypothetical protein